ncbi:putative sulfate exporter family transporter [Halanaerobiaceae bacterium Z-7014]|uniref:Sulfate exporter family transporter n=1 Tax=Halonatronomonas betaini TaxID=2778430 RepID=A0A931AQY8_9FIRM|nr:putative sulfate exporter family transporter [Halonatronomonas betaini]MBF8437373.1 putative sulfate exporter family transporter [Halonatronomonas betaini]
MIADIRRYIPGLVLITIIALLSQFIAYFLPDFIGAVFIAIIIGIILNNTIGVNHQVFGPGIKLGLKRLLKIAIILLGGTISFQQFTEVGLPGLGLIVLIISVAFVFTFKLGDKYNLTLKQKLLIAAGLSICGDTAIITIAPVIKAEDDDIFMSICIVTFFGVLAIFIYPIIGLLLSLSDTVFGAWAGTAISSTSQVVATGFIFSEAAGQVATMIKLTRNVLMIPVIVLIGYYYNTRQLAKNTGQAGEKDYNLKEIFPNFILGFLALIIINSLGLIPAGIGSIISPVSRFLILLALSGIGLGVDWTELKEIGGNPFIVGFLVAGSMALISIVISSILFL